MKKSVKRALFVTLAAMAMISLVSPVMSQEKPADNMQILLDKVKADKKLLIATNMELTEAEAKGFWPIYEAYQKDLAAIHQRIGGLIESYAADYMSKTITDEKAKKLTEDLVAIQKTEGGLQASYVPKLSKVLPAKKMGRYLQIENKIRAVMNYALAAKIPIVE